MNCADDLGFDRSYYLASAHPAADFPALGSDVSADIVVVGGGCTGLSAALHAAELGFSVVLLESGRIGWGASGRNGGQIIPGLRQGADQLLRWLGPQKAAAVLRLAFEARDLVVDLVDRFAIDCDLRLTGHLTAAVKPEHFVGMRREVATLSALGLDGSIQIFDRQEMASQVASPYAGGVLDRRGGHFHPLNYALGLCDAAARAGASIHEHSAALTLSQTPGGVELCTAGGRVSARFAVLAGDALLRGLDRRVEAAIMPVASYVAATEPLADPGALIPTNVAVSDSRFVVNYYRLSADGRLLFGGGERYSRRPPSDIAAFVRPHLEGVFPSLVGVPIDFAWGGLVSITRTRLPDLGRCGPVLHAHGYSGMGAVLSTLAGKLMVEAMTGRDDRFERFAALSPPPFPGGEALRGPLHVAGMLWYALRDRL